MIFENGPNRHVVEGVRAQFDLHLEKLRRELGLDAVMIARLAGGERRIEAVSVSPGQDHDYQAGNVLLVEECEVCLAAQRGYATTAGSQTFGVGAPVVLSNGTAYGVVGGVSQGLTPDEHAAAREAFENAAQVMTVALDLLNEQDITTQRVRGLIRETIHDTKFFPVFQPVIDLVTGEVVYFEGLTRLHDDLQSNVGTVLKLAHEVGLGSELEIALAKAVIQEAQSFLPAVPVAVNLSETAIMSGSFWDVCDDVVPGSLIVELTEHDPICDSKQLAQRVAAFQAQGGRLAIDDIGSGYASLAHMVALKPDIIKIDQALSEQVHTNDEARQLLSMLKHYGDSADKTLVIEGVETAIQLETIRALGLRFVQGYHIGLPRRISESASA